jgi:ABC-2 type transport system permease protein
VIVNFGIGGTGHDSEVGSLVITAFWALTSKLLAAYPIQLLWMIPSVGWFMLVSSISRSSPVLWSVAVPIAVLFFNEALGYLFQIDLESLHFLSTIRWLAGTVPGSWEFLDGSGPLQFLSTDDAWLYFLQHWAFFNNGRFWLGTAFGIAMMYAAVRMRQKGTGI